MSPTNQTALTGPVRVRFAPSPTGFLHVGGARTAIYNDLLRQSLGGAFVLRIEDTDRERSDEAMTRQIQSALGWIGVGWDEGPHLQSARLDRHRERAGELLARDSAYRCFCTPEELDERRRAAQARGETFRYPGTCARLDPAEVERRLAAGLPHAVRFRLPPGRIRFRDLVRGDLDFPPDALDDFILLRSDGSPTYHLSVVVDDVDMAITHVVRGDDHLSNTPKHVALFAAFGAPLPVFGHLPLILGPDRKRLSKRTGSTSVEEFRDQGILPQALYNYLALLGWAPGDDRELMTREEMIALFTVERLNAAAAVFDREKLAWMNGQYLTRLPLGALMPHLAPFLARVGLGGEAGTDAVAGGGAAAGGGGGGDDGTAAGGRSAAAGATATRTATEGGAAAGAGGAAAALSPDRLARAVDLHRGRAGTLAELAGYVVPYFRDRLDYDPALTAPFRGQPELPGHLARLRDRYAAVEPFAVAPLEVALRSLADELGVKAAHLIHPLRRALTAGKAGPPVFDVVAAMGRDATLRHLDHFLAHLGGG
jgi:glutamyl-tRNA synthetase